MMTATLGKHEDRFNNYVKPILQRIDTYIMSILPMFHGKRSKDNIAKCVKFIKVMAFP